MVRAPLVVSVIPYPTEEQTGGHVKSRIPQSWTGQIPFQSLFYCRNKPLASGMSMPSFFKKFSAVEDLNGAAPQKTRSTLLQSYWFTSEPLLRVTSMGGTRCITVTYWGKINAHCTRGWILLYSVHGNQIDISKQKSFLVLRDDEHSRLKSVSIKQHNHWNYVETLCFCIARR